MSNLIENCKNQVDSLEKRQSEINDLIMSLGMNPKSNITADQPSKNDESPHTSTILNKTQNVLKNFNESYRTSNNSIALKKAFEKITDQKISQNTMKTLLSNLGDFDKIYLAIRMKNFAVIANELEKLLNVDARSKFDEVLLQPQISDKLTITTSYIGIQHGDSLRNRPQKYTGSITSLGRERSSSFGVKKPLAVNNGAKFIKGSVKEILKEKTHRAFDDICKDAKSSKASPKNQSSGANKNPPIINLKNTSRISGSVRSRVNDDRDISKTLNPKFNKNDNSRSFISNQNKESLSRSLSPNQPIDFKVSPPSSQKRKLANTLNKSIDKQMLHKTFNTSGYKKRSTSDYRQSSTNRSFNKSINSSLKQPKPIITYNTFKGAVYDSKQRTPNPKLKPLDSSLMNKKNIKTFQDIISNDVLKNTGFKSKPLVKPISQRNIKIKKPQVDNIDKRSESHSKSILHTSVNVDKQFPMTHNPSRPNDDIKLFARRDSNNNFVNNRTDIDIPSEHHSMQFIPKHTFHQKTPSFNFRRPSSSNTLTSKPKAMEKKPSLKRIVKLTKEASPYTHVNNPPKMQNSQTSLTNLSKTQYARKSNCLLNSSKSEIKDEDKSPKFIFETSLRNNSNHDKRIANDLEIINYKPHKRHYPEFDQFYFNNKVLDF